MAGRTSDVGVDEPARSPAGNERAGDRDGNGDGTSVTREAVLDRLDRVSDPELDRSIVELEYVDEIEIDLPHLFVRFKLPTAWCSPTFAWMMATGIRDECEELSGVEQAEVELIDHMHTAEINEGVNARLPFEEAFEDATEGIEETRRTLDRKARLARQYRAVDALLDAGMKPAQIVSLTPTDVGFTELPEEAGDVDLGADSEGGGSTDEGGNEEHVTIELDDGALYVRVPREPIAAYVEKAIETDLVERTDDTLFATPDGEPIEREEFDLVHRRARSASVNQTGQGGICASLHEARYGIRVDESAD